jgi:hypothetical protein
MMAAGTNSVRAAAGVRPSRAGKLLFVASVLLLIGACGERAQTITPSVKKLDAAPYSGPTTGAYADKGWKAGDKVSWETHMRARTQSQNDYAKTN